MSALALHPNPAMYLSPEFVHELALGKDPEAAICARHGVEPGDYSWLAAQPWFAEMVAQRRMQLQDGGILWQHKAAMMAEEMYSSLFKLATTGNLAAPLMAQVAKDLSEQAGMRPEKGAHTAQQGAGGPAFQLNITVNAADAEKSRPVDVKATVVEAKPVVSVPLGDGLPPRPAGFRVPDFKLTPDLIGTPQAQAAASVNPPMALTTVPR